MRYPDSGGLTAAGRARREQVRLRAAALFEQGVPPVAVANDLRVSTKSAYQWHRRWRAGGTAALASTGPDGNPCRLNLCRSKSHRRWWSDGHQWVESMSG
ncbi:helix-turn-helix domain-containing protein [Actinophytocola sp.]|uniref:helix-turn-helix domain-containing protein n=1 Tax=Actinophytocola sp. TaxID=1872138 RepID=UPI00389B330D